MKVLLVNGSPNEKGCTFTALSEIAEQLEKEGIESEMFQIGKKAVRGCIACGKCYELDGRCVFDDDAANKLIEKAKEADGFIFGSPVYYASANGSMSSLLDRAFYAGSQFFAYKPGACVVSARRGGTTAAFDQLNKYLTINNMPVVSSQYWNMVHGFTPDDVRQDKEGLQVMRGLGRNMAWLLKCIELGKKSGITPSQEEEREWTNFIR